MITKVAAGAGKAVNCRSCVPMAPYWVVSDLGHSLIFPRVRNDIVSDIGSMHRINQKPRKLY